MDPNLIVLLTDFGETDAYVGIMKGVICGIAPDLKMIDLSHQIPPGDIQEGAFHLWQAAGYFPPKTVFLAVVDPGVGTGRRGLFLQRENQIFIGPDNGLFSYISYKSSTNAWELVNPSYQLHNPSRTFHGRDIFAPAAAYAALGIRGDRFGNAAHSLIQLPRPLCEMSTDGIEGEVISVDRFGNLITSLGQLLIYEEKLVLSSWVEEWSQDLPRSPLIRLSRTGETLPLVSTYNDIPEGSCAGLVGSSGLIEIASKQSSTADLLDLARGDRITLSWKWIS
jgi:S-adenosylmethionine hydrolase